MRADACIGLSERALGGGGDRVMEPGSRVG